MKRILCATSLLASVFCAAVPARADLIPPEVYACQNKQAGDTCTNSGIATGVSTCQNQTCSRLDYTAWDRDASSGPPSTAYACLKCLTGSVTATNTAGPTATATVTSTAPFTTTPTGTATGTSTVTPTTTLTGTATATGTAPPTTTPTETETRTGTTTPTDTVTGIVAPTKTLTETATVTITATATPTSMPTSTTTTTTTATETTERPGSTATDTGGTIAPPPTATNTDGDHPPASDDSACSVGKPATAKRIAPWLLAGIFSLLFLFGRRRKH